MAKKLELVWPGDDDGFALVRDETTGEARRIPYVDVQPRLLLEESQHGAPKADNMLIQGENLYALKTLVQSGYSERVKLIYIDPPYNTGNTFSYYDDGLEHSLWLTMMRDRLALLHGLLRPEGTIWVQLDDSEVAYCRLLMDAIFGQHNFITTVIWQKAYAPRNNARFFSTSHDYILVYAKDILRCSLNLMKRTEMATARYRNPDNDPRGPWKASDLSVSLTSGQRGQHFQRTGQSPNLYLVTAPSGRQVEPPANRCWSVSSERFAELNADNRIWWGKSGDNVPALKRFLSEVQQGIIPQTVWMHDEVGHNQEASKEIKALFDGQELFSTPKPERLLQRIIDIGSDPGDLVLDCFLGSGTTAAVAHKLGRRWIGIELNYTASRIYLERLKKVIDGHDQGGISKYIPPDPNQATSAVGMLDQVPTVSGWQGGGGFCFYRLGQALLERDAETGVWKLNYTNSRLVEAICLLEGFHILADGPRHGVRGRHYAHITDHFVTQSLVDQLGAFLDDGETLTIYAAKAATLLHLPDTIDVKRIPHALIEERTL